MEYAVFDSAFPITPDDNHDLSPWAKAFSVGVTGDVKITDAKGVTSVLAGIPAGFVVPVRVKRVWASGTSATKIHGYS